MQKGRFILNQNKLYFSGLILIFLLGMFFLMTIGKESSFLLLNSYHPFYLNVFFINYTFIGDGIFAISLIAMMFLYFKRKQCGFALVFSFSISGMAAQVLKNLVNSPRPKIYFEAGTYLNFIDGVTLSGSSSFPSGHTATAFAIATVIVLMTKNKIWQLPVLAAAVLVGYSRIYLAQHFLIDILMGALIGSLTGVLSVYIAQNVKSLKISFKKLHRFQDNISQTSPDTIHTV